MIVINLIILFAISFASYKIANKSFLEKDELKGINKWTIIIFQTSFILSNLIISFIVLYIILPVNKYDILLWKLFLTFFSFFFFYSLPFYLIYNLFDSKSQIGKYKIFGVYSFYLISSNIIYRFFNRTYEESIFRFNFYFNYSNILEYLAFIGDLFNGVSCAYNAVNNISSLLVYPLLKKRKFVINTDSSIKKSLEDINNKIFAEEAKLNELNLEENELIKESEKNKLNDNGGDLILNKSKEVSETKQNIEKQLHRLKSIQLSYEFQLDVTTKKENKIKQNDIITMIFNIIKIIQSLVFLLNGVLRCFAMDYSYYSHPINMDEKSSIHVLLKTPYIKFLNFSDGFIIFVEQVYSLSIIFIMFSTNLSIARDTIMAFISYVFSYLKKDKSKFYDVQMIVFSVIIFSYYLVCGLLIVNSMKYIHFRDRLHRYLFPGFDFENLHWYYDCPYVLAASFFIVKEIVEYSNIISPKID